MVQDETVVSTGHLHPRSRGLQKETGRTETLLIHRDRGRRVHVRIRTQPRVRSVPERRGTHSDREHIDHARRRRRRLQRHGAQRTIRCGPGYRTVERPQRIGSTGLFATSRHVRLDTMSLLLVIFSYLQLVFFNLCVCGIWARSDGEPKIVKNKQGQHRHPQRSRVGACDVLGTVVHPPRGRSPRGMSQHAVPPTGRRCRRDLDAHLAPIREEDQLHRVDGGGVHHRLAGRQVFEAVRDGTGRQGARDRLRGRRHPHGGPAVRAGRLPARGPDLHGHRAHPGERQGRRRVPLRAAPDPGPGVWSRGAGRDGGAPARDPTPRGEEQGPVGRRRRQGGDGVVRRPEPRRGQPDPHEARGRRERQARDGHLPHRVLWPDGLAVRGPVGRRGRRHGQRHRLRPVELRLHRGPPPGPARRPPDRVRGRPHQHHDRPRRGRPAPRRRQEVRLRPVQRRPRTRGVGEDKGHHLEGLILMYPS
ncbi:uncharacterized protein PV06_10419 [Exophiala oligosperma]|uniref:Uncharacterized protein n=1 Tax=Exophiala oligosperma TaxID=215243 RepID=A0A0D2D4W1_9EURO|nr:uncharacterized protein PV06_10419 [Exophiala oligosperma]KIW37375.1 hypothetical protein PV06_10419 [Exophiala oligosperma]